MYRCVYASVCELLSLHLVAWWADQSVSIPTPTNDICVFTSAPLKCIVFLYDIGLEINTSPQTSNTLPAALISIWLALNSTTIVPLGFQQKRSSSIPTAKKERKKIQSHGNNQQNVLKIQRYFPIFGAVRKTSL